MRRLAILTAMLALAAQTAAAGTLVDKTLARLYRTGKIKSILARTFGNGPMDETLNTMFLINALPE
jgi:hypothetical protein